MRIPLLAAVKVYGEEGFGKMKKMFLKGIHRASIGGACVFVLSFLVSASFAQDTTPPAVVSSLAAIPASFVGGLTLSWAAPGNDGNTGNLGAGSAFYIQYSTYSGVSWSTAAAQVVQSTSGVAPSTLVRYTLGALDPGTTYYAAVWHKDEAGNLSGLSNIASGYAKPFPVAAISRTVTGVGTWHVSMPGTSVYKAVRLASDPGGNIYMAGLASNGANDDLLLQKYDPSGNLLLAKFFNGSGNCSEGNIPGVAVDSTTGAFYLAGSECLAGGAMNILLIKYDASGQMLWQRRSAGTSAGPYEGNTTVKTGASGDVYLSGCIYNGFDNDSWLRKYDSAGSVLWTSTLAFSSNSDCLASMAVQGNSLYAAGSADMSGLGQGQNGTLWKVDANTGLTQSTTSYNGTAGRNDDYQGIVLDAGGNIYLSGDAQVSAGNYALLSQKRDPAGLTQWTNTYDYAVALSTIMTETFVNLAISADNYLYFVGVGSSGAQGFDAVVMKRDLNGTLAGKYAYNGDGHDDAGIDLLLVGDKVILGGNENVGGVSRNFIRKINASDVTLAPAAVAALTAVPGAPVGSLSLSWPAPGNDGTSGVLGAGSAFYIQYSTYSSVSWSTASAQVVQSTSGVTPSTMVKYTIAALDPGTTYYAAVWHKDAAGNLSGLSNITSGYAKPFPGGDVTSRTSNPDGTWHVSFNSMAVTYDITYGLVTDATGNIYVSGRAYNGANNDLFVHKYDAGGNLLLAKYYNGTDNCSEGGYVAVAVDPVTGSFYLAGGECGTTLLQKSVLIKYDASGQVEWKRFAQGTSPTGGQALSAVSIDPAGDVYVGGSAYVGVETDHWVRKYTPLGDIVWTSTYSFTGPNNDAVIGMYVKNGYVYATGTANMNAVVPGHGNDLTLWKLNTNGLTQWTTYYTGAANFHDYGTGVAADEAGNIYLGGGEQVAFNDYGMLMQKRNPAGLIQWTTSYNYTAGSGTEDFLNKLILTPDNYLYAAGYVATAAQGWNCAVLKRDLNGALLGRYSYDVAGGDDAIYALAQSGDKLVLGGFETVGGQRRHFIRKINASDVDLPDISAPAAVAAFNAVPGLTAGVLSLNWPAPGDDGASGALSPGSAFFIQYSTYSSIAWSTASAQIIISTSGVAPGAMQSRLVNGLQNNTSYYLRLWTRDESGNISAISNEATSATAIEAPAAVNIGAVSTASIVASASAQAFSNLLLGLSGTNVAIDTNTWTWAGWHGGYGLAAVFTGLTPNTRYTFKAKARNQGGVETQESPEVSTYTTANPPGTVSGSVYVTSATLTWGLNSNPAVTLAQVFRSTDGSVYSAPFSSVTSSYADTGLQACTSYYYKVRNINGGGIATAYTSPLQVFTGNYMPLPSDGLEAVSLDGRRISLSWLPSPDPALAYYRLYADGGTGTVDYNSPIAVLPSTVTAYTTGVLVSSPSYTFAVRTVNRCGSEEANLRVLASAPAMSSLSGVRAAIKDPHSGKKVSGNSLTIIAEIILGEAFQVSEVRFQYKASASAVWSDIVAANANHPNPDTGAPYFVHWDVSGLSSGNYDLRAVASDNSGNADDGAPSVTLTVDNSDFEVKENVQGDGTVKKEQVINNAVTSVVQAADADQSWVTRVSIPSEAVNLSTVTLSIVSNPLGAPAQELAFNPVGQAAEITLSNAQHGLDNGQKAEIALTYPDSDGDGVVDGTSYRAERLQIFSYDTLTMTWKQDLECSVDKANNRVIGHTPHFSYFAVFAPAAIDLNSSRAYPNPWKPGSGGRFDAAGVTFDNLTSGGSVKIFTIAGELVRELSLTAADAGAKVWNGRNTSGSKAASGVYIVRISYGSKEKTLKLAVER